MEVRHLGITIGVTGLDTETIIQELMKIERQPLIAMQNNQQNLANQKTAWERIKISLDSLVKKTAPFCSKTEFDQKAVTVVGAAVTVVGVNHNEVQLGEYEVEITSLARSQVMGSGLYESSSEALGIEGSITINGNELTVAASDTLEDIAQKINAMPETGVKASVLKVTPEQYQLVLTAANPGTEGEMTFESDQGIIEMNQIRSARDAVFSVNGVQFVRSRNHISDVIKGINFDLGAVSGLGVEAGTKAMMTVAYDDKAIVDDVKSLVAEYNSFLDLVKNYTSWDADKKVGGLLFGDPMLQRLITEIRAVIFRQVGDALPGFQFAGAMGLSTGPAGSVSRDGKLTFDDKLLTDALRENRAEVSKLLGASTDTKGIFNGLKDVIQKYASLEGFVPLRKQQLEERDKSLSRQIEQKQRTLDLRLASLQRQFSSLEVMLSKLNSQGAWLSQQIAGMYASSE